MVLGIFGILRIGCAYVPADPSNPAKRIESLFKSANIKYVVTTQNLKSLIEEMGFVAVVPEINTVHQETEFQTNVSPYDNAYVLFTSGSTGTPKGVIIAHHSVVNLCEYIQERYPINQGDVILLKSPYTFDGSVWELFGWILMGGTLYICNPGDEKNPKNLCELIKKEQINFMFFVPSMLSVFLDYAETLNDSNALSSLKWVSVGGEVLTPTLVKHFYSTINNKTVRLFNVYGPTETCVYATTFLCDPNKEYTKLPIGELVTNDYIYILDENLKQKAFGEEGEICIGGSGVANGYLNLPEFTNEKFITDPVKGEGLIYRTGDIGKELPDGLFDFIGRKDFQVKLRGLRIEMGEVETALQNINEVLECIVLFAKDRNNDDSLIAYLRTNSADVDNSFNFRLAEIDFVTYIKSELNKSIPQYMIPSEYIKCDLFPINQNGKIDRNALPSLKSFNLSPSKIEFLPSNEAEELIYLIWKKVLGKELIGDNEDFFQAGGHSLKAIQTITEIIQTFKIEIPLHLFYETMTLKKMSCYVIENMGNTGSINDYVQEKNIETNTFPITPVQKEMWIMNNFDTTGLTHNIQVEFTIKELTDIQKFIESVKMAIESEEIFRSSFPIQNQEPIQFIHEKVNFEIPITNLIKNESKEEIYESIIYENGHIVFNLNVIPLFSFQLVIWEKNEIRLLMAIHHIIFDGWSLSLFMQKLIAIYNNKPLNISKYRNGEYAIWLNNYIEKKSYQKDLNYWRKILKNIPKRLALPLKPNADFTKSGIYGKRYWFKLDKNISKDIDNFSIQYQTTAFVILLSAYQIALAKLSGQKEVIVGTPFANRQNPMCSELIGYYTNMVSIPSQIDEDDTFIKFVKKCNEYAIGAFSNSLIPYGELVKQLNLRYEQGNYPIFQVIFVLQNWAHYTDPENKLKITQKEIGNNTSKMDFLLNVENSDNEYVCWIEYDTELYNEHIAKELAFEIKKSLNGIIYKPEIKLSSINSNSKTESKTCIIIGEGSIAVHCTKILIKNNFNIKLIITKEELLKELAQKNEIKFIGNISDENDYQDVDYIFSINNGRILKEVFLGKARILALNYHDSPLPKYAGMFATNHAILNGEKSHGISWHTINNEIDGGDIIASSQFVINDDETAYSLNLKCYEYAIQCFESLIPDLLSEKIQLTKQDKNNRSLYPLNKRPSNYGIINWNQSINEIEILKRACFFGKKLDNEFLAPSIYLNNQFYTLLDFEIFSAKDTKPSFVSIIKNKIAIDCKDAYVVIDKLLDDNGIELNAEDILVPNTYLEKVSDLIMSQIDSNFKSFAKYESYWLTELYNSFYFENKINISDEKERKEKRKVILENLEKLANISGLSYDYLAESILSLYFLLLSGNEFGTIAYVNNECNIYFSKWKPLNLHIDKNNNLRDTLDSISHKLIQNSKKGDFCANVINRYYKLKELKGQNPSVFIIKNNVKSRYAVDNNVIIHIDKNEVIFEGISNDILDSFLSFYKNIESYLNKEISIIPLIFRKKNDLINKINKFQENEKQFDVFLKFTEIVKIYPDKIAVFDEGKTVNYSKFYSDICSLTAYLKENGVQKNTIVAVGIPRTYEYFLSIMAVLGCGAAFLSIDTSLPIERQEYMLNDSNSVLFIHKNDHNNLNINIKQINISKIDLSEIEYKEIDTSNCESIAYVIYTSGSTGKPKGVKISRKSLSGFIDSAINLYNINHTDRILQFSNLSFDASLEEIFCSFCSGASLFLRTEEMLEFEHLIEFSKNNKISVWDLPTAFWRQLINNQSYISNIQTLDLRLVIIGGEAVTKNDFLNWTSKNFNKHQLYNTYGPTETTIVALAYEMNNTQDDQKDIPIGNQLQNVEITIKNKLGYELPYGVEGELIISGDCVADGYINCNEAQNAVFIKDAISNKNSYKTGDLVYSDESGLIYYKGRIDDQLKIRGFRIEPKEIESKILDFNEVEDAFVFAISESNGDKILTAFYTCPSQFISESKIRDYLTRNLPKYMVPNIIKIIDKIPLTKNGKADRQKLSEIALKSLEKKANTFILPSGKTEIQIHEIWKMAFNREEISVTDDFFEIGGHSLIAVQVMGGIKNRFKTNLPLSALISNPSIRQLSDLIESKSTKHLWDVIVPIRREGNKTPIFLIHGAGLNVLLYQSLSRNMESDRPIYAVQAKGLDGEHTLNTSIEDMANQYITEIKKVQPYGPYNLLGFSLGGFIAYEMSLILLKNKENVDFLGVIDSITDITKHNRNPINKLFYKSYKLIAKPIFVFWLFLCEPFEDKKTFLKNKYDNLLLTIKYYSKKSKIDSFDLKQTDSNVPVYLDKNLKFRLMAALQNYVLKENNIELNLFKAEKSSFFVMDRKAYGWNKYAKKGVKIHLIPGDHTHIFAPPNDKIFAKKLDEQLQ